MVVEGQSGALTISAKLVVAADGWDSAAKTPAGTRSLEHAYGQMELMATVSSTPDSALRTEWHPGIYGLGA